MKKGKDALAETLTHRAATLAPWIVTLWLVAMTGWYIETAFRVLWHPINQGNQIALAMVWLILLAAVVLSHWLLRRRFITLIWAVALVAVGLAMITLSRQSVAALISIWLMALAWIYGDWLLRRMGGKSSDVPLEWVCLACTIGLVLLSMVGLTLLLVHCMSPRWTWIVLLVLTLIQWRSFLNWFERIRHKAMARFVSRIDDALPEQGVLLVLLGIIGLFNLAWALAPEILFDGVAYHLAVPKTYLAEHGLVNLPYGYNAHLVETLFTVALALHGQIVAKLLVLAMSILAAFGVYALGRRLSSPRVGLWAAALFYSTPLVSWLSSTTYIDLVVALFLVATLLAFLRWRETWQIVWLLATAFLGGTAVGAKLIALFGLPVIAFLLVMDLLRTPGISVSSKVKALAGCALAAFLVAAPYFLIVYIFTGNPIFPFLNGIFTTGSFSPAANLSGDASDYSLGYSPLVFLKLPFMVTFQSHRFGEGLSAGALGIALPLLPLGLLLMARRKVAVILLGTCVVFLALLGYTMPYARYYIPILPVVMVLAIAAVIDFSSVPWVKGFNLACLSLALVAQAALIPLMYWNIPERVPLALAFGTESQEAFLTRALPPYRAVQYINRNRIPGERILGVGVGNIRFYLQNPLSMLNNVASYSRDSTVQETAASLARDGFAFLFVHRKPGRIKRPASQLPPPYVSESFLTQYAVLEYAADNTFVYRLRETAGQPVVETNRLTNPSFELKNTSGMPADWDVNGQPPHIVEDATRAHTGQISVLADSSGELVTRVPVEGDKMYSLGHWTRADLPEQHGRVQINWLDADLKFIHASISVFRAETKWTWHQLSASSPPEASFAEIYVSVHENSEIFFDDYVFVPGQLQAPQ
jgi:4-amino-4-deoxy-L-arabinose transferase-like glycosyltransferase